MRKPTDSARSSDPADQPLRGVRQNSAASAAELREFLSRMRGKPPQEVIGLIAQSGLARAMFLATLLIAVVLFLGTLLPFANKKIFGDTSSAAGKANAVNAATKQPAKTDPAKSDTPATATADAKSPPPGSKEAALNKLGIGEAKTLPGNANPLENRADDILKDFDKK